MSDLIRNLASILGIRPWLGAVLEDWRSRGHRRRNVGHGSRLHKTVQVLGWKDVRIGSRTFLAEGTWLNVNRHPEQAGFIEIGDHVLIGRRNFISSGPSIRVGAYTMTGVDVGFLGAGHVTNDPYRPYLLAHTSWGGPIIVGVNCWLATSVMVMGGGTIGHGSCIGARSFVTRDIPPFSIAFGNPCQVMKRFDFAKCIWVSTADWTAEDEARLPSEAEYLGQIEAQYPDLQPMLIHLGHEFDAR